MAKYNFSEIEKKWNDYWEKNKTFETDVWDFSKPKFYCLDMFPYPSGQGLHVGHPEGYIATDIISRVKRMQGYNVLHPMGFDAFGLPAEQYAISTGNHPAEFTLKNIETFKSQLKICGLSFDWSKEISTCDPKYYKWTQWIFEELYKAGLAKYIDMPVNWCEELGTVLANDEIIDGKSERGGYPVVKKNMRQWVIDIPQYADKLLKGLDELDWPNSTKIMQRNWIGKSEGAIVHFAVADSDATFDIFTTRIDTLFGATYCVLAPEHDLVSVITMPEQKDAVADYQRKCASKSDIERTDTSTEKTGVFTGAYAINPANNKRIPIYIADYVLSTYATGAIMAVPAHDERDYDFATKYGLDIIPVVEAPENVTGAFVADGKHINSQFIDGLNTDDAKAKMFDWLEQNKLGYKKVNYKLREWIFARQRYWGEPLPVIHMDDGTIRLVDIKDLPVELPVLKDYHARNGEPPLANATEWVNVNIDGKHGKRETATMPGSAGSSWYFLRYVDSQNDKIFADKKLLDHWLPVDLYVGGSEHAVGHLLYSRFWNRFLSEKGYLSHPEPFKKLVHQGMILAPDGRKMSKRWGNVINPNDVVAEYGADVFRMYEMFMGPIQDAKPWNTENISGVKKFLDKVWSTYTEQDKIKDSDDTTLQKLYHQTIKKVTNDYENLSYNTAISQMMIFMNAVQKAPVFPREYAIGFIKVLSPIAPYIGEEIWNTVFGNTSSIAYAEWPKYDEALTIEHEIQLPVQVNGKLKSTIMVPLNSTEQDVLEVAKQLPELANKNIVKVIYIPNKIINLIVK